VATGATRVLSAGSVPPHPHSERVATHPSSIEGMSDLSAYELQRQRNIAANNVVLQGLGLLDSIVPRPSKPPVAARSIKRRLELDRGPKRAQPKRDARPQYTLAEAQAALVGAEREERGAKKRRKKWRRETGGGEAGSDEGGSRGGYLHTQVVEAEAKWSLPPLAGGGEHRKSCHICTQGVASWRGDFSRPLGCSTCPLIWCSRCLTNIYSEFQEEGGDMAVHAFIAQANLLVLTTHHSPLTTWCLLLPTRFLLLTAYRLLLTAYFAQANAAAAFTCPMCLGACACQLLKGGKVMERHKRAGWVGVTGNADPSCSRPHLKKMQACTCVCDALPHTLTVLHSI
jgi:hypothetical protein